MWIYDRECRLCQQTKRVRAKHDDPVLALLLRRAGDVARRAGIKRQFVLEDLNYWSLLPFLRAALSADGLCPNCGHEFNEERDVQFDHVEPPRHRQDFARLHARNVTILCGSCNNTKAAKAYADWLDDQEEARLSANALQAEEAVRAEGLAAAPPGYQLTLDDVPGEAA
jgi:5-methylcytosine-specific restriction endonuclease McrA